MDCEQNVDLLSILHCITIPCHSTRLPQSSCRLYLTKYTVFIFGRFDVRPRMGGNQSTCRIWYIMLKKSQIYIFTFVRWALYKIYMNRTTFRDLWVDVVLVKNMYYCASSIYFFRRKANPARYQNQFCIWAKWFVVSVK